MKNISENRREVHRIDLEAESLEVFRLFQEFLPKRVLRRLEREEGMTRYRDREPIFTGTVVIWLMLYQRLSSKHTLSEAVKCLKAGRFQQLHGERWRKKCAEMSTNTSGYSQARSQLSESVIERAVDEIQRQLLESFDNHFLWHGRRVMLCDGSKVSTPHEDELLEAYPTGSNQLGKCYWPEIRVLLMHDLLSGIATSPTWGPMRGPAAIAEQGLFKKHIKILPERCIVMGDSNFGIFSMVHHSVSSGHDVVFEMADYRAKSLDSTLPRLRGERKITWTPSGHDLRNNREIPPDVQIKGRVIVGTIKLGKGKKKTIYLFTTLKHSANKILKLYKRRWWIETDFRTIKRTVDMDVLNVKTESMLHKELLIGIAAYSLVRATMAIAALRSGKEPRNLSFSYALDVIHAHLPFLQTARSRNEKIAVANAVLEQIALCPIHTRKKQRKRQPRILRNRRRSYPVSSAPRNELMAQEDKKIAA